MTMQTMVAYAEARVWDHISVFNRLAGQITAGAIDSEWLATVEDGDNVSGTSTTQIWEVMMVTKLVLMVRDPTWAYVYWDIDDGDSGPAEFRLLAEGSLVSKEPISLDAGGHEVALPAGDRSYTAELARDGDVLVRSLPVAAPPAAPRAPVAPVFVTCAAQQAALVHGLTLPSRASGTRVSR